MVVGAAHERRRGLEETRLELVRRGTRIVGLRELRAHSAGLGGVLGEELRELLGFRLRERLVDEGVHEPARDHHAVG